MNDIDRAFDRFEERRTQDSYSEKMGYKIDSESLNNLTSANRKTGFTEGYKQGRIEALEEIQTKLKATVEYEWEETVEEYIDTELAKEKDE